MTDFGPDARRVLERFEHLRGDPRLCSFVHLCMIMPVTGRVLNTYSKDLVIFFTLDLQAAHSFVFVFLMMF